MEQRHSYGIIPIRTAAHGHEVLIVQQIHGEHRYWCLAKGTPEAAESPKQTAQREMYEELGLEFTDIEENQTFKESYSFQEDGVTYEKTNTYYLGVPHTSAFVLQDAELADAAWLRLREAEAQVTYPETKQLLMAVRAFLEAAA